jgi:hypothetical protein
MTVVLPTPGQETEQPRAAQALLPLIHMLDQNSDKRFLMDTGAKYSILPHQSSLLAKDPELFGPAGQDIPCWGDGLVHVRFQGCKFTWKFLLANVAFPILGVYFLQFFKLV